MAAGALRRLCCSSRYHNPLALCISVIDGIQLRFYAGATGLELLVTWVLAGLAAKETITLRRAQFLDYLNRSVIGLPFTVYLTVAGPHTALGLLRFLTSLYAIPGRGVLWIHTWFTGFYCGGLLFVSYFRNDAIPAEGHVFTALAAAGAAVFLIRAKWLLNHRLVDLASGKRRALRDVRKGAAIESRLARLASAVFPKREALLFQEGRDTPARRERILLIAAAFPGFDDRVSEAPGSPGAETSLYREWERFVEPLHSALLAEGFFVEGGPGGLAATTSLEGEGIDKERLARGLALVRKLLTTAVQFRRAEESRGRRLWHMQIALAVGDSVGLSCGGGNPSWTHRGRIVRDAENHLAHISHQPADAAWDSLWIHEELCGLLGPFFQNEGGGVKQGLWQRAGALRADLAADPAGTQPAQDFVARARYSGLI
ncbi:MAG: hypothetical protein HY042_11675 [Spirochaetia bacterium]|nr:hypothetical protein [Spirochaetia bacterium]